MYPLHLWITRFRSRHPPEAERPAQRWARRCAGWFHTVAPMTPGSSPRQLEAGGQYGHHKKPRKEADYFRAERLSRKPFSAPERGRQHVARGVSPWCPCGRRIPPGGLPTPGVARGWEAAWGKGSGRDRRPGADAPGYVLSPRRGFWDSL